MAETPAPSGFGRVRAWWTRQSQKLKDHFAEYGGIAIATYFAIFFLTWAGFAVAISRGVTVDGAVGDSGTIGAAWLATKATQPLRILATLAVTPIVAAIWHRVRGHRPEPIAPPTPDPTAAPTPEPTAPRSSEPIE